MRSHLVVLVAALGLALVMAPAAGAQQVAWEQWQHQVGIVDVGTRADGSLVAMAAGRLFTVAPGAITPLVTDFTADPNAEPYFGAFGGWLIAPDENSGRVLAVDPLGQVALVNVPNLPTGGDTGVESEGFVPPGFLTAGGFAYMADRGTPNNPFPGTDSILRISAAALASAGVQEGDLLVATEGNGTTVGIRCGDTCSSTIVVSGTRGGHIEGKITFSMAAPQAFSTYAAAASAGSLARISRTL